jgi:hypothetical protein
MDEGFGPEDFAFEWMVVQVEIECTERSHDVFWPLGDMLGLVQIISC